MRTIDLHAHTTASDGRLSPTELVRLAAERGVEVLGITDHDTTAGVGEARGAGEAAGVRVVAGIELSSRVGDRSVHVLGLFVDPDVAELVEARGRMRAERLDRAQRMVARLNELGYELTFDEVTAQASGDVIARPHIARALVARGYVPDVGSAFTPELIGNGGRAEVQRELPSPVRAVGIVAAAGGVAVLAHPGVPRRAEGEDGVPEELVTALARDGLAGLEVDHPDHPPATRDRLGWLADELGLVRTGGSDCHGREGSLPGTCRTSEEAFAALEEMADGRVRPPEGR